MHLFIYSRRYVIHLCIVHYSFIYCECQTRHFSMRQCNDSDPHLLSVDDGSYQYINFEMALTRFEPLTSLSQSLLDAEVCRQSVELFTHTRTSNHITIHHCSFYPCKYRSWPTKFKLARHQNSDMLGYPADQITLY